MAGGVEDQIAEQSAGGGFDDSDVEVVDEDQDAGSGVGSADADVVQAAGHAQRDGAGLIEAVVGVGAGAGVCFGSGLAACLLRKQTATGPGSSAYTSRTALLTKRRADRNTSTWLPSVHDGAVKCGLGVRRHSPP